MCHLDTNLGYLIPRGIISPSNVGQSPKLSQNWVPWSQVQPFERFPYAQHTVVTAGVCGIHGACHSLTICSILVQFGMNVIALLSRYWYSYLASWLPLYLPHGFTVPFDQGSFALTLRRSLGCLSGLVMQSCFLRDTLASHCLWIVISTQVFRVNSSTVSLMCVSVYAIHCVGEVMILLSALVTIFDGHLVHLLMVISWSWCTCIMVCVMGKWPSVCIDSSFWCINWEYLSTAQTMSNCSMFFLSL